MPKKKRKPRNAGPGNRSGARRHVAHVSPDALVEQYAQWLPDTPDAEEYVYLVSTYLGLKARFRDADPTAWTEEDVVSVLTELLPANAVLDEEDRTHAAGAMASYLRFLTETARSSRRSIPPAEQGPLLDHLERQLPVILADPSRRSMNTNLLTFATSQGIGLTDADALGSFMDAYGALSRDERIAVTEPGALPPGSILRAPGTGGAAFGLGSPPNLRVVGGDETAVFDDVEFDDVDEVTFEDFWPPYLGPAPDESRIPDIDLTDEELADFYDQSLLVRRADAFMAWLGGGRPVTRTGALRRAETATVRGLLELAPGAARPRSMWDVPELAQLWSVLLDSDFIEVDGATVRPVTGRLPWAVTDAPTDHRLARGLLLHAIALLRFLDDTEGEAEARTPPYTVTALLKAAEPDGFTVPARDGGTYAHRIQAGVTADLVTLEAMGVVERREETFHLLAPMLGPLSFAARVITEAHEALGDFDDDDFDFDDQP